jgi:hypothetical protein
MAHKLSTLMIAAFTTLAAASLIAMGASAGAAGQGAADLPTAGNGDCDRTMDKLQAHDGTCDGTNCTCDGTESQSGAKKTVQDRICSQLLIKQMSQNHLTEGSSLFQQLAQDRICRQIVTEQMTQDRLMDGSCLA